MRNLSKQNRIGFYQMQPNTLRHCTSQKRLSRMKSPLKETDVRVGKYKFSIDDVLGKGFSSKVYKGVEIGNQHKKYAIKAVNLKKFRGSNFQMLQSQIEIHRSLQHDNIVRCYDAIKTPNHYYIILQYCPHGSLLDYINQKKKIPENMTLNIIEQIFGAYKYLLEEGVVHRDLKPANILRIGNKWKIADFGFAVRTKFQFKDRLNVGTPLYMPFEALTRNQYSYKTDLFALGIILYEMVTGKMPWECHSQDELLAKIKEEPIKLSVQQCKNVQIIKFVSRACHIQENKRFTVEEAGKFCFKSQKSEQNDDYSLSISQNSFRNQKNNSVVSSKTTKQGSLNSADGEFKENAQIFRDQMGYCRFLYDLIVNEKYLLTDKSSKNLFVLALNKYLLKLVKGLENKKINCLNLKAWDRFKISKMCHSLQMEASQAAILYEKGYLQQVKKFDIETVRGVNRRFPQLSNSSPLNSTFYEQLKQFVAQMLRSQNHNLSILHKKQGQKENGYVEGLESLHKLLKAVQVKKLQLQNNQVDGNVYLQKITSVENYQDSKLTWQDYINMRRVFRSI